MSGGAVVARNSVLTLVVYAGGEDSAPRIQREVESVTRQVPSRAVIIVSEMGRSYGTPFDVSVGLAHREGVGAQGEQILIRASEEAIPHLPGAVLPLILSGCLRGRVGGRHTVAQRAAGGAGGWLRPHDRRFLRDRAWGAGACRAL